MTREIDFKYRVLRNNAVFGELHASPDGGAAVLRMDDSAEIKTSLSGTFFPDVTNADGETVEADWLKDEIQPVLIVDGAEHDLGVFMPATVTPWTVQAAKTLRIEAYDRCWRVRDTYTTSRVYFAASTPYRTAIDSLLSLAGVTLVYATPTAAVLAEDREWEIGVSALQIVNELLREINYNELWFDASGAAILEPASTPTVGNIEHTFDADDVESLIVPQVSRETDVYSAPNVFLCLCSNPDKSAVMSATAKNTNPQSPLSIPRRGREIVSVTQLNNVADQDTLQAYADRLRNESMIGGETIRIQTALIPGFGVADVVALHYEDIAALCIERAYTMELRVGGTMSHELERVVYNLG